MLRPNPRQDRNPAASVVGRTNERVWESKNDPTLAPEKTQFVVTQERVIIPEDAQTQGVKRSLEKIPGIGTVTVKPSR